MSTKIGRNDPCPCGSGNKYKKCCLGAHETNARGSAGERPSTDDAVARALAWLAERYPRQSWEALEKDYYGALSREARQAIEDLPEGLNQMQRINALEWLIAEGSVAPGKDGGERPRFVDLVLSENGPLLDAQDRAWLRTMGEIPLKLYEIVDVEPGEGLWLEDAFAPEDDAFFVRERSGSETLRKGDAIGARVMPGEPPVLSGALYPFEPEWFLALRRTILTGPRGRRRRKIELQRVSEAIIQSWLERLVKPPTTLVDAATGDPILLTNIHYRVRDWARVEAALKANPLVESDSEGGWTSFESTPTADEPRRILWSATRRRKKNEDRIEVFARTAGRADEAERWFQNNAGEALEKIARELSDPAHIMKTSARRQRRPEPPPSPLDGMSPEDAADFNQQIHEQIYRNWHDEPIPALGNKTPKQAMRSKAGRLDVVELLKSYETQDRRRAEGEGRPPIDYRFLWKKVGLSREKER
jgi:hypothetical protein